MQPQTLSQRAVIIGPYFLHNFGDDLIGLVIAQQLQRLRYEVTIPGLGAENARWLGIHSSDSNASPLRSANLIINGGGGTLGDTGVNPSEGHRIRLLKASLYGRLKGRPVITTAMGAGPLSRFRGRLTTRMICALSQRIGVRDYESQATLQTIGVPSRKITTGADVALLAADLPFISSTNENKLGIQFDINPYLPTPNSKGLPQHSIRNKLIEYIDTKPHQVLLLRNSDRPSDLLDYTTANPETLNYTLMPDFLSGLTRLRCIVTSHLHLAIAAYANRIPCFSVYVREKTARFYRQIGRPERALPLDRARTTDIEQFIESAKEATWQEYDEKNLTHLKAESRRLLQIIE